MSARDYLREPPFLQGLYHALAALLRRLFSSVDRLQGCGVFDAVKAAERIPVCRGAQQHNLVQLSRFALAHTGDLLACADAASDDGLILFGRVGRHGRCRFFFSEKLHNGISLIL